MNEELPTGVGPHEGKEYELLVACDKHVALFTEYVEPRCFKLQETSEFSAIFFLLFPNDEYTPVSWIIYRNSHFEDALELRDLVLTSHKEGFVPEIERKIGKILGYTDTEIEAWIKHWNR